MDVFRKGWYTELSPDDTMWPGQAMSLEVDEVLLDTQTPFQHLVVVRTKKYGIMLCLDGVIQITERDEHGYQEMIANLPMCAHPSPERVAVIGGGDGGVLREVTRHPSVKVVDHCEIDEMVCTVSREYLPDIAIGLSHPTVHSRFEDGAAWLRNHAGTYDVIIVDSSDPVGPAATLFSSGFYATCKAALRPGGILCTQAECMWNNLSMIGELVTDCGSLFKQGRYAYTTIPTYPSGQIGFLLCTDSDAPVNKPARPHPQSAEMKYYSAELHAAAFVLPKFAEDALAKAQGKAATRPRL